MPIPALHIIPQPILSSRIFKISASLFLFLFIGHFVTLKAETQEQDYSLALVGGKAASLFHLQKVEGINVPPWFVLSTKAWHDFLNQNQPILSQIKRLDEMSKELSSTKNNQQLEKAVCNLAKEIRDAILNAPLSQQLRSEIHKKYEILSKKCDSIPKVAVRSSGIAEDLPGASFAGVYDTFLNQQTEENVLSSIKGCWASVFNDRAVVERNRNHIRHSEAATAVIIQQMVDAKYAGTAFTMEIGTGYPGIEIAANYGLGEGVVGGEVSVDKWLVHPNTLRIIKSNCGSKKFKYLSDDSHSGTNIAQCSEAEQHGYVLNNETVTDIASQVRKIGQYYSSAFSYKYIDTEFAIDKTGKLFFVQARSLVPVSQENLLIVDKEDAPRHEIIAHGRYSVPGTTCGKVKVVPSWNDLSSGKIIIEPDDIVVTRLSSNYWTQYMTKFKGMITQEGGPTSHPILLSREQGVPCVIGFSGEDFEKFIACDGQYVTLDGINRVVYKGQVTLKKASPEDFSTQFEVVKPEEVPSFAELTQKVTQCNRVFVIKNEKSKDFWIKSPIYTLDPLSQEIHRKGYDLRAKLVGISNWPSEVLVINDFLCEKLVPQQEILSYFSHMDLAKAEEYLRVQEKSIDRYLALTTPTFTLNSTSWDQYLQIAAETRAYRLLGFYFRTYVNHRLAEEAMKREIPRYYLEAYETQIQSELKEMDLLMVHTIDDLAKKFQSLLSKQPSISLSELQSKYNDLYKLLEYSAKQFRFQEDQSFKVELNLEAFLQRISKEIKKMKNLNADASPTPAKMKEDFFPQDEILQRWTNLAVRARVAHCNVHHYESQGLWNVRETLLKLGDHLARQKQLKDSHLIFEFSTPMIQEALLKLGSNLDLTATTEAPPPIPLALKHNS